jgi:hypothetical protein
VATLTTNVRTIQASTSVSAGGTQNGTAVDVRTTFGGMLVSQITNGATGPTVQCQQIVQVSRNNTDWIEVARNGGGTGNNLVTSMIWVVPPGTQYVRVQWTAHTGQAVTVEAYLHEATSINTGA